MQLKKKEKKQLRWGLIATILFLIITFIMGSFFVLSYKKREKAPTPDLVYRIWKLEKLYQNGKSIENHEKFAGLKLKVNRDGTAEWIRPESHLTMKFQISEDGSQIFLDDGYTVEDIETVFELTDTKFRFGKRNIASRYEYVMVPAEE